ncbi:MAG: HAD-IIB family hydrolase [Leptolyngbyaceae cyanobacterium SL_1_1]|nr:HAD-IIB family hydrolase [Leptolyngbyaceae cyanobacterium RM1_1_2]NJO08999.1 HAD-IIB family hydrolase [Leptolyngbyaceae cyanobacterium SL_1_1]
MSSSSLLIFTDLDGTLLDSETYSYAAAYPLLQQLKTEGIAVIPVTSKTRTEVETLIQQLSLETPFITENGSGVFIPVGYKGFELPEEAELVGRYWILQLGCPYVMTRAGLKAIAQSIGRPLKGFGDLSIEQIQQLTGLSAQDAKEAKAREFTEPFLTPKNVSPAALEAAANEMGFRVVVGDRFSHLIGSEAGKGAAALQLKALYQAALPDGGTITTLGLGNSPNDIDLLENVDIAVVIPGQDGPHPRLSDRGWQIAPQPGPEGWAIAVRAGWERAAGESRMERGDSWAWG